MKLMEALAYRIDELMKEMGLSQYRLSMLSGVAQATLSDIKHLRNKSVSFNIVYEIAEGFGISLYDFFDSQIFKDRDIDS